MSILDQLSWISSLNPPFKRRAVPSAAATAVPGTEPTGTLASKVVLVAEAQPPPCALLSTGRSSASSEPPCWASRWRTAPVWRPDAAAAGAPCLRHRGLSLAPQLYTAVHGVWLPARFRCEAYSVPLCSPCTLDAHLHVACCRCLQTLQMLCTACLLFMFFSPKTLIFFQRVRES